MEESPETNAFISVEVVITTTQEKRNKMKPWHDSIIENV
jgi:hypothetical protein